MISDEDQARLKRAQNAGEVEFDFLAGVIGDPDATSEFVARIRPEDFHQARHAAIWRAISSLHDKGSPIDLISIWNWLRGSPWEKDLNDDYPWLEDLWKKSRYTRNTSYYSALIKQYALERDLHHTFTELLGDVVQVALPPDAIIERAQSILEGLADRDPEDRTVGMAHCLDEFSDNYDKRQRGEIEYGVSTGIRSLDANMNGGFPYSGMTIISARPSVGKTSIALQFVRHACKEGKSAVVFSLEQERTELIARMIAAEALVNLHSVLNATLTTQELHRVNMAKDRMRNWRFQVNDATLSGNKIAAIARKSKKQLGGLDLIVIDYLDLIEPASENARDNRNEQIAKISYRIRRIAKDLKAAVVLLCQMNRSAETQDRKPRLSDLRNSGAIEQDADVVIFLHRACDRVNGAPDKIDLLLAKQRNGPQSELLLDHHTHRFTFEERIPS
jgi:replicative DNA helicase